MFSFAALHRLTDWFFTVPRVTLSHLYTFIHGIAHIIMNIIIDVITSFQNPCPHGSSTHCAWSVCWHATAASIRLCPRNAPTLGYVPNTAEARRNGGYGSASCGDGSAHISDVWAAFPRHYDGHTRWRSTQIQILTYAPPDINR